MCVNQLATHGPGFTNIGTRKEAPGRSCVMSMLILKLSVIFAIHSSVKLRLILTSHPPPCHSARNSHTDSNVSIHDEPYPARAAQSAVVGLSCTGTDSNPTHARITPTSCQFLSSLSQAKLTLQSIMKYWHDQRYQHKFPEQSQ